MFGQFVAKSPSSSSDQPSSQTSSGAVSEMCGLLAAPGPDGQPGAHVTPGPWRARGSHARRRWPRKKVAFRSLQKWSGNHRRRMGTLREALVQAAGGEEASAADVLAAARGAFTEEERNLLAEEARDAVRAEVAADATWIQWGELGRKLVPLLLKRLGNLGESLLVEAARESASYWFFGLLCVLCVLLRVCAVILSLHSILACCSIAQVLPQAPGLARRAGH